MGHKILLADDSITIQKVIELTFSDEDFELHTVGNGQKAIDEIRAIQPDIVLCDIIMPEKNGYEVCEYIKSNDDTKHIPVLLLTGAFEPFDQERAKAAGCEGFLAKPFEPQTLISKVKELLKNAVVVPAPPPTEARTVPQPDPVITQSATPVESDATVLVPPPAMGATPPPPVTGPQAPATPTPPPAMEVLPPGLDEGFAVEAGERELSLDPGDHTMLLGENDAPEAAVPPPPSAGEDIWGEVASTPAPTPPPITPVPPAAVPPAAPPPPAVPNVPSVPSVNEEPDAATVFMAAPPPVPEPGAADLSAPAPVDNEMEVSSGDPDATWQMPVDTPSASGGEFGGFEDFAAPAPPSPEPPPAIDATPPAVRPNSPLELTPDDASAPAGPLGEPPQMEITPDSGFQPLSPEPIPSVDTRATMDPVMAGVDAFSPVTPEPPSVVADTPEHSDVPEIVTEPETPFTPAELANDLPTLEPEAAPPPPPVPSEPERSAPFPETVLPPETPEVVGAPVVSAEEPGASSEAPPPAGDDDLVERVAQRVVDKLSAKVIQEIAWEVVPDLAEGLIQKEIDVLKSKIPKTG